MSLRRGDSKVYELPFVALEDIPAGTELTFNYTDDDEDAVITDQEARRLTKAKGQLDVCVGNENAINDCTL